jgi:hypothetical protein
MPTKSNIIADHVDIAMPEASGRADMQFVAGAIVPDGAPA